MSLRGLVAAAALTAGMTYTDDPLTTREMRALSAGQADRHIRQDLLSILRPAGKIATGNMRRLHDTWLHTRAYATQFRGLCRRDTVSVAYAPTVDSTAYEDTPIRPYAVDVSHSYYFAAPPRRDDLADDGNHAWRSPFQAECDHAGKDEWSGWFTADDPHLAMLGAFALQAAVEWARMPGHELAACAPLMRDCAKDLIASAKLENLDSIATCDAARDQLCYKITAGSFDMTIKARKVEILTAADIISVDGDYDIIVT